MNVQQMKIPIDEAQPAGNSFIEECSLAELHERIRVELLAHLALIGLDPLVPAPDQTYTKDLVRSRHAAQRAEFREGEQQFLFRHGRKLLPHFAEGREVIPEAVDPAISLVISETEDADLFLPRVWAPFAFPCPGQGKWQAHRHIRAHRSGFQFTSA